MYSSELSDKRRRNRDAQARYMTRHFGEQRDLSRLRADVRLEARAALERVAADRNVTLTMLIEELAFDAERRLARRRRRQARAA
jgi:predicted DNA-binding ribbon-helix-helix protein